MKLFKYNDPILGTFMAEETEAGMQLVMPCIQPEEQDEVIDEQSTNVNGNSTLN